MFKKWRSCVSLLVCLSCMLSGLYLNTLGVKASSSSFSVSSSYLLTYNSIADSYGTTGYISPISGGGGYLTSNGGNIMSNSGGGGSITSSNFSYGTLVTRVRIPYVIKKDLSDFGFSGSSTDFIKLKGFITSISCSLSGAGDFASVGNIALYDYQGNLIASGAGSSSLPLTISNLNTYLDSDGKFSFPCYVECDITVSDFSSHSTAYEFYHFTFSNTLTGSFDLSEASTSEVNSSSTPVADAKGHELQEESNTIQEETKTTTNNIFDKISDFFGSFFENIKNALVSVFVPEDGYFSNWFNRLNTMLSDKLGILYWPFDKVISFFERMQSVESSASYVLTFPAIEFNNVFTGETYHFLDAQRVSLYQANASIDLSAGSANSSLVGTNRFNNLVIIIRTFNSFALIFGLLSLLRKKLNIILRGVNDDN